MSKFGVQRASKSAADGEKRISAGQRNMREQEVQDLATTAPPLQAASTPLAIDDFDKFMDERV